MAWFNERKRSPNRLFHSLFNNITRKRKPPSLPKGCSNQLINEKFTVNAGQPRSVRRCECILVRLLG